MLEKAQSQQEVLDGGPQGLGDPFAPATPGMVSITCGPYAEALPVAGRSVSEIRAQFADRFELTDNCQAIINGQQVGDDIRVRDGQILTFIHPAGEKG